MTAHRTACAVAAALACAVSVPTTVRAAITLAAVDFWTGTPAGPGLHQAALVIDFNHPGAPTGAPSLVWGYRWPAAESRTGHDLLAAVVAADPRLDVTGLEFGFIDTLRYDADLDGAPDFTHPGFDPGTGRYSAYWVNNAVVEGTPPLFADAEHLLPPNGNPYASEAPGAWVFSSTGLAGRPLADGSWDGWVYASEPLAGPREPVAAVVPEPRIATLVLAGPCLWLARRRRAPGAS
jgi:hypothetical protein